MRILIPRSYENEPDIITEEWAGTELLSLSQANTDDLVGIKGHAAADAVVEAPTGGARALMYIVRGSPSFLHQ